MITEHAVKRLSLIDIGEDALKIEAMLYDALGEITPEQEAQMDALLAQGKESLDAAAWVVRKMEADEAYLKAEADRYKARSASIASARESLKGRMAFALEAAFGGKLKTERNTLYLQKNPDSLTIELAPDADLARLDVTDSEFVKKTYALDTTAIRQRYQAGDPIPNAIKITENAGKRTLRMK